MPAFIFIIPAAVMTALVMHAVRKARKRDAVWLAHVEAINDKEIATQGVIEGDFLKASEAREAALRG